MVHIRLVEEPDNKAGFLAQFIANTNVAESALDCACGLPKIHLHLNTPCGDFQAMEHAVTEATPSQAHIDRRHLRAYHRKIQDFILRICNVEGYPYRLARNACVIYPPDGSEPITIYARNTERQLRTIRQWYEKHGGTSVTDEPVEADVAVNVTPLAIHPLPTPVVHDPDDWQTHFSEVGQPVPNFETNGSIWRCRLCIDTPTAYEASTPTGIGGHNRMAHGDRSALDSPEAKAKAVDTKRFNRLSRQIEEAVTTLATTIGLQVGPSDRVAELEAEVARLKVHNGELEARLALILEAYRA